MNKAFLGAVMFTVGVVVGCVFTKSRTQSHIRNLEHDIRNDWQEVALAQSDLQPHSRISREMIRMVAAPRDLIAQDAVRQAQMAENHTTTRLIRAGDQIHT